MRRFSLLLFFTLLLACVAFIVGTFEQLPPRVASHFGSGGESNGWMRRETYLLFMLGFATLLPSFLVGSLAWLPRFTSRNIKVPNREYWLAPARRGETLAALGTLGGWLGCLLTVFIGALHYTILDANSSVPPRMPGPFPWTLLGGFVAATLAWQALFWLRFRAPKST
jgi:Protein of unknown function (DUF1648)